MIPHVSGTALSFDVSLDLIKTNYDTYFNDMISFKLDDEKKTYTIQYRLFVIIPFENNDKYENKLISHSLALMFKWKHTHI